MRNSKMHYKLAIPGNKKCETCGPNFFALSFCFSTVPVFFISITIYAGQQPSVSVVFFFSRWQKFFCMCTTSYLYARKTGPW